MTGKELRIVFMGTPDFAVASLKKLNDNGYNVVGVVTSPDKPAGRGQQLAHSAVKIFALEKGLHLLQPANLKDPGFIGELEALKPDLQVVVAFRMLPQQVWSLPHLGTFNLHGSLLPKYRGAAPINWAIINGETETGVSTFLLKQEIDTGNILFQEKIEIGSDDNFEVVHDKLMDIGADLVLKTVNALAEGQIKSLAQEELIAKGYLPTPAPKIFKDDCLINWNHRGEKIRDMVRGLSPYPSAWTHLIHQNGLQNSTIKIFKVNFESGSAVPGEIASDLKNWLKIGCADGWILVQELQMAGKKRMSTSEFLRGFQQISQYRAVGRS